MTYESLRNQTLLFFIEKLLETSQSRTLHDLSCQFGSKGFTREMRHIAGNSQSGLKKFLLQYPSLFEIQGDLVNYKETSRREEIDSVEIAVEFFKQRLLDYGIGVGVPIKSLLGHRSQAPLSIRHITGQNIEDFTLFLKSHPKTFKLKEEVVTLSQFRQVEKNPKDLEQLKTIINLLSKNGPLSIQQLYQITNNFKSPEDIKQFLETHKNFFIVDENLVALAESYSIGLKYLEVEESPLESNANQPHVLITKRELPSLEFDEITLPKKELKSKNRVHELVLKNLSFSDYKRSRVESDKTFSDVMHCEKMTKNFLLSKTEIVTNSLKAKKILEQLKKVSLSLETFNDQISLITLSDEFSNVYIFDTLTNESLLEELRTLLESEIVIKTTHDCSTTSHHLFNNSIRLKTIFDIAVASTILDKKLSLSKLTEKHNLLNHFPKPKEARYWSHRPLTPLQICMLASEVLIIQLIGTDLRKKLDENDLNLLKELTQENLLEKIKPEEIRLRRKLRKNERDLEILKDKIEYGIENNEILVLSNREMRLLKHLQLSQLATNKLKSSLKIAKKLEKLEGNESNESEEPQSLEMEPQSLEIIENIEGMLLGIEQDFFGKSFVDAGVQTFSTGDVVVLGVFEGE